MKFAVRYFNKDGGHWMERADELIINFDNHSEEALSAFITKHNKQRVIVDIKNFDSFKAKKVNPYIFKNLIEVHNLTNWALRFNVSRIEPVEVYLKDTGLISEVRTEKDIHYFYNYPVETFEQLDRFLYTNVTDVYVTNSLAFDLKRVKEKIEAECEFPPQIRVYPNICQSYWADEQSIRSFFVRPEDVKIYEPYVDVMEIYAETIPQLAKADVYLDIYKRGDWFGDLQEYLINCNQSIDNKYMFKDFGEKRLGCRKKCLVNANQCNYCLSQDKYLRLMSKTMDKMIEINQKVDVTDTDDNENIEDIRRYIGEEEL